MLPHHFFRQNPVSLNRQTFREPSPAGGVRFSGDDGWPFVEYVHFRHLPCANGAAGFVLSK
jgi:hypothetical protein